MSVTSRYDRRTGLKTAEETAVGLSVAGCLREDDSEGTVLSPPKNYDRLEDVDLPYYGEELPEASTGTDDARTLVGEF